VLLEIEVCFSIVGCCPEWVVQVKVKKELLGGNQLRGPFKGMLRVA
jgi:hypothetical protein